LDDESIGGIANGNLETRPTFYPSPRMGYEDLIREKTHRKAKEDKR
jgi:hypothetical protein